MKITRFCVQKLDIDPVIVFETQENYKIDTKNQDEIKDYIDNTK